jgi:type I restriction enzyme, S subunit
MALTISVSEIVETSSNRLLGKHESWGRVLLGDVATVLNGFAFKSSEFSNSGGVPLIRIRDVGKDRSETTYLGEYDPRYVVEPGDLLVGMDGDFNCARWRGPRGLLNQRVCKITLKSDIYLPKFLDYTLPGYLKAINDVTSSVTVKHLSSKSIEEIPLPLPPKEAQQRLVAEIEKQFSRLDEAVANLKRVKANLKRYKASVLKAAVEGKLTADWRKQHPNVEPASSLISRTPVPPRPNRWNSRSKDVILGHPALAVGNPGLKLPSGWTWSPLVDIARMESGHTPSREHPEWWDGVVPWIGIADAREHDGRVIMKTLQHTNKDGLANSAARLLPSGTVCVSRTASVGYVVVLGRPMATSQDFVNWIPTAAVTSEWLRVVFSADREALRRFGKGSVHKTIYFPEWLSVHIGVPPISEQNHIVAEVERRLSVIEELEAAVEANLTRADRLRQSILAQAFSRSLRTN